MGASEKLRLEKPRASKYAQALEEKEIKTKQKAGKEKVTLF